MAVDYASFSNQFILCKQEKHIPAAWQRQELRGWQLGFHHALPATKIQSPDSSHLGWLLGYPIDDSGEMVKGVVIYDKALGDHDLSQFESWLHRLGGTFAAILITPRASRFYLDAAGSLPAVFHPESEIVASTPTLVSAAPKDEALIRTFAFPELGRYFPFGLTSKKSVERAVPNHYLDLTTWTLHRHWPDKEKVKVEKDTDRIVQDIASIITSNIRGIAKAYHAHLSLTAGQDTRVLLACTKDLLDNIAFYTWKTPDKIGTLDCVIASEIAQRFHLRYKICEYQPATEQEMQDWLDRTGYSVGGRVSIYHVMNHQLNPECPILTGIGGEGARAYYYVQHKVTPNTRLTGHKLAALRGLPQIPEVVNRADAWLQELSDYDVLTILDLFYIEQALGCWDTLPIYGNNWNVFQALPFCHRRIFERMLSLSPEYRISQKFGFDLIKNQWPELLKFPFNNYRGFRGLGTNIRRHLIVKSLAKAVNHLGK